MIIVCVLFPLLFLQMTREDQTESNARLLLCADRGRGLFALEEAETRKRKWENGEHRVVWKPGALSNSLRGLVYCSRSLRSDLELAVSVGVNLFGQFVPLLLPLVLEL